MKSEKEPLKVTDMNTLAVLDAKRIGFISDGWEQIYYANFEKEQAAPIVRDYLSGKLEIPIRDFTDALRRVKDRIFTMERELGLNKRR